MVLQIWWNSIAAQAMVMILQLLQHHSDAATNSNQQHQEERWLEKQQSSIEEVSKHSDRQVMIAVSWGSGGGMQLWQQVIWCQ